LLGLADSSYACRICARRPGFLFGSLGLRRKSPLRGSSLILSLAFEGRCDAVMRWRAPSLLSRQVYLFAGSVGIPTCLSLLPGGRVLVQICQVRRNLFAAAPPRDG